MIIEIKDLPDGVMIKNINIDFVEGTLYTESSVESSVKASAHSAPVVNYQSPQTPHESLPKADQSIPSEMLTSEF